MLDDRVERLLRTEAERIVAVSEDRENFSRYQFFLSDFPRQDLFGMSIGARRIYISYRLASRALTDSSQLWLFRQTVAHEIAHETASHAQQERVKWLNVGMFNLGTSGGAVGLPWYVRLYNYSTDKELEADRIGLGYWNKLGWDCQIWVQILENFQAQTIAATVFIPPTGACSKPRTSARPNVKRRTFEARNPNLEAISNDQSRDNSQQAPFGSVFRISPFGFLNFAP